MDTIHTSMAGPLIIRCSLRLSEAHFILHGWLRRGNCASARGGVEFFKEALEKLDASIRIRTVRADSVFLIKPYWSSRNLRSFSHIIVENNAMAPTARSK